MTQTEALRLALEALQDRSSLMKWQKAINAVEAALEAKDKPVAWGVFEDGNIHDAFTTKQEAHHMAYLKGTHAEARPLYATPPQRTWVGLTDEDIEQEFGFIDELLRDCVQRTEAKLKEKNT
jgi:hypothetical protein